MIQRRAIKVWTAALLITSATLLVPGTAIAFGHKRPSAPTPPPDTAANPSRVITIGSLLSTPFMLPDGKTKVDMAISLPTLLVRVIQQSTNVLQVSDAPPSSNPRFVLKGGLTSFVASDMTGSITVGYSPGVGDIGNGSITGASGTVSLNVGALFMDYYIVDMQRGELVVASGHGDALTPGVELKVGVNFGTIGTGADFVLTSPLAPYFASAAQKAIMQMVGEITNPKTDQMDWSANVTRVDTSLNQIFFNAGTWSNIAITNVFEVYDNNNMAIGEIKVSSTSQTTSGAAYKNDSNNKLLNSTKVGDTVKLYPGGI